MRIYVSHAIRGVLPLAPGETMEQRCDDNNRLARACGEVLYRTLPIDWYVPGAHDDFPLMAYRQGHLTIDQILDIDCEIIRECAGVLIVRWEPVWSDGMKREIKFAENHYIPMAEWATSSTTFGSDLNPGALYNFVMSCGPTADAHLVAIAGREARTPPAD